MYTAVEVAFPVASGIKQIVIYSVQYEGWDFFQRVTQLTISQTGIMGYTKQVAINPRKILFFRQIYIKSAFADKNFAFFTNFGRKHVNIFF